MLAEHVYAHIATKPSGKAIVDGTRVSVADIAALAEEGLSAHEIQQDYPRLTLAQIHSALAYYYDHKEDVEEERARAERMVEGIRGSRLAKFAT